MRKLLILLTIYMFAMYIYASPIYMVETDRGMKSVLIPDDMTEREV